MIKVIAYTIAAAIFIAGCIMVATQGSIVEHLLDTFMSWIDSVEQQ